MTMDTVPSCPWSESLWKEAERGVLSCIESKYDFLTVSCQIAFTKLASQFWVCDILLSEISPTDTRLFPGASSLLAFLLSSVFHSLFFVS